jgi:hypothetical protein
MLKLRELKVTMTPSLKALKWKIILMKKGPSMSFQHHTLTTKWSGRKEKYDSYKDGKNHA